MAETETKTTNGHSRHPQPEEKAQISTEVMMSLEQAREEVAYAHGLQAYLWGYPLYRYCRSLTQALKADTFGLNTLRRYTSVDGSPAANDVTIEAKAAYDVSHEPVVVHVPHLDEPRWYLVQIGDTFDELIANVGGAKGPRPGDYVITGPDFAGRLPAEMTHLQSRTKMGIITVQIFVGGEDDLPAAIEAQRGFHVMRLSTLLRDGLGHHDGRPAPVREPALRGPADLLYFELLGHALQSYLPAFPDSSDALVSTFRAIGLTTGDGFDWRDLDPTTLRGLSRAAATGEQIVDQTWEGCAELTNGWRYVLAGGRTSHDLALRAALAKYALGSELPSELLAPTAHIDHADEALTGEHNYVLELAAGQLPPVSMFWNLALYDDNMHFVDNDLRRHSIGSTTPGLRREADGSIRILIQHEPPDALANWLPSPTRNFSVTMRLYGPQTPLLDGTYRLPAIRRHVS